MTNTEASTSQQTTAAAERDATVSPKEPTSTKVAVSKKNAPQAKKGAKKASTKPTAKPAAKKAGKPAAKKMIAKKPKASAAGRANSKKAKVLDMLGRTEGATLAEIGKATGWQPHSIRGFISTITKKMELPIASLKNDAGERCYRIEK